MTTTDGLTWPTPPCASANSRLSSSAMIAASSFVTMMFSVDPLGA
jgi:hypothetical protein